MATIMSRLAKKDKPKGKTILQKVSDKDYFFAEGILDDYAKGKISSSIAQKRLKSGGFTADLKTNRSLNKIMVFPLDGEFGFEVEL
tara:strand:+ start:315 stop:572 length:258 start_codon:yes stop_codon:yes gene_type:complete